MIKVVIKTDELSKKITSVEVKGHSNKDTYGKDLVCAAVSTVVTGAMNAIDDKKNFTFVLEEGNAVIQAKSLPNDHDAIVLETMQIQLQTIEESEPKFVRIEIF